MGWEVSGAMAFGLPACNEYEMNKRNRLYLHLVRCTPPDPSISSQARTRFPNKAFS